MRELGHEEILEEKFLRTVTGQRPLIEDFGPATERYSLSSYADYPASGLTTIVTIGVARHPFSMWRGRPLGFELVLTLAGDISEAAEVLKSAVLENHRRVVNQERRRVIEVNGVWAPGYAPHLLFTTAASATPNLMVTKKVGDRYVEFLSAVPIDDRELREYDRDIPRLIAGLAEGGMIVHYPRPVP